MGSTTQFPTGRGKQVHGRCGCGSDMFHLVMRGEYVLGIQCAAPECGVYVESEDPDGLEFIVGVEGD